MLREDKIDIILKDLEKSGSQINYLEELKNKILNLTKKDISLNELMDNLAINMKCETSEFLEKKNKFDVNYIS